MGELYPSFLLLLLAGCSVQFTLCKDFDKTAENVTDEHTVSPPMKKRTIPASIPKSLYISFFKGKDEAKIDAVKQELKNIIDKLAKIAKIKAPKLCKGIQVISECNARCLNADVFCEGSDLVKKAEIPFSAAKLNASTYSTTWSVPDARRGDRCTVTCPEENNNSFSVKCENHIMDKKDDPPRWFNVERVRNTCKSYEGEDKRLFF